MRTPAHAGDPAARAALRAGTWLLDVDGTLVDTNYHHTIAWYRALAGCGVDVPAWRIHRHMGMGGDQLVEALAGAEAEERLGDAIRDAESERYGELIGEVRPLPGARELIRALADGGRSLVLSSSAKAEEVEHYVDLLDARAHVEGWTTSADVDATKPEPDLVAAALERGRDGEAVLLGDSLWDCEAAARAGVPVIAVLTGGVSRAELEDAGAVAVFESLEEVRRAAL